MIRTLVLFEYGSMNGGEHSFVSLVPGLRQAGVDIHAAAPSDSPLERALRGLDVPVHSLETADDDALATLLRTLHDCVAFDLIHANSLAMSRRVGRIATRLPTPALGHLRDIIGLSTKAIQDINALTRTLAVSEATRRHHVAQGLDASRCRVMFNGVDLERFAPVSRTEKPGLPFIADLNACIVTTIGQIGMRKGLSYASQVMANLMRRRSDVQWVLVGRRHSRKDEAVQYERDLHAASERPPLKGRVHFVGEREDVPRILRATDVLFHAARQEPLGRVLIEAAASGLAIVATDVGGTREIFPEDNVARVCDRDDLAGMESALLDLVSDPDCRAELGRRARRRAETAFTTDGAARALAKHYRETVALGNAAG